MTEATFRIELFSRKPVFGRRQHYFRIVSVNNGKTVAQSEGYANSGDREITAGHLRASLIEARMFNEAGEEVG